MEKLIPAFYSCLQEMGKVDRLYCINFIFSMKILPPSLILEKVKPLVGDGGVYKLIESYLSRPLVEADGTPLSIEIRGLIPVGEITTVLFNLVLMVDREFQKRFPGIVFARHIHEVFIPVNEKVIFDENAGYAFLEEVGLVGEIVSIGPGDKPLPCVIHMISLDSAGQVQLCDP